MYVIVCLNQPKPGMHIREVDTNLTRDQLEWDFITGQHEFPIRVLFVNSGAGICNDISVDLARWIVNRADSADRKLTPDVRRFCENWGAPVPARLVAA